MLVFGKEKEKEYIISSFGSKKRIHVSVREQLLQHHDAWLHFAEEEEKKKKEEAV